MKPLFDEKHATELVEKKNDTIAAVTAALATKNEELAAKDEQMLRILGNQEREGKCNCSIVAQNYVRGAQKSHQQTTYKSITQESGIDFTGRKYFNKKRIKAFI